MGLALYFWTWGNEEIEGEWLVCLCGQIVVIDVAICCLGSNAVNDDY